MKHISWLFLISLLAVACASDTPCKDGQVMGIESPENHRPNYQEVGGLRVLVSQQQQRIDSLQKSLLFAQSQLDSLKHVVQSWHAKPTPSIRYAHGDPTDVTRPQPILTPEFLLRQRQKEDSIKLLMAQIQRIRNSK